ncbi:MAG TPA: methionine adenosyltransferase [Bacteroidales bacterium]|nr:methionine adenosyltransferase [Bacteroidales bacterium]
MSYLFTSESVSEGHPDKVADQISDALVDAFLAHDKESKVACETLVTTGLAVLSGEVRTTGYIDAQEIAREVINKIGYTKQSYHFDGSSCGVISAIHEQSDDINRGVVRAREEDQGAGDQGMMFGYATDETDNYMPLTLELSQILLYELAAIRREDQQMKYLAPDSKSQVTIEYDDENQPIRIDTIVVSTQHDAFDPDDDKMVAKIKEDVIKILIPRVLKKKELERYRHLFKDDYKLHVNPTGKFVIGGPHGDTGLTGRKIIVDTYGGKAPHGGGAFSGKDPSKVDRSAAYAARHMAKNLVAAGVAREVLVQVAYAIGVAEPVGLYVNTFGTAQAKNADGKVMKDSEISKVAHEVFDMRPYAINQRFQLKNPIYQKTASYGHFGRDPFTDEVEVFYTDKDITTRTIEDKQHHFKTVQFFGWEKLDYIAQVKKAYHLK